MIECVPNVSEGRRLEVVEAIAQALRSTAGIALLDYSADPSHNRSVFTFAGDAAALKTAVLGLYTTALPAIDLRTHRGEHPRLGAVDVVPFVPLDGSTLDDCITLARSIGGSIADRFAIPVYLYEAAALTPERRRLEIVRRGGFEGLAARMAAGGWDPDFGPRQPHPTAGASIVGARLPLIAFNVNLATNRIEVARAIAAAVRESNGGLPFVKALGLYLADRDLAQVSMNLTNFQSTSMRAAFDRVAREAARLGVDVLESELIGLVPAAAAADLNPREIKLARFSSEQVLEHQLARRRR